MAGKIKSDVVRMSDALTAMFAVLAARLKMASGASSLVPWKVSLIVCYCANKGDTNNCLGEQQMGDAVSAGAGAQVTMNCKFLKPILLTLFS
jgi:hypothetical protein